MTVTAVLLPDRGQADSSKRDYFRCASYLQAENATHTLALREGAEDLLRIPLIVREIAGTGLRDATSPYGYPGGCAMLSQPIEPGRVDWSGVDLVTIFVRDRLNGDPLFTQRTKRNTVYVADPARPLRYHHMHDRHIRRNRRNGLETLAKNGTITSSEDAEAFAALYRSTMSRHSAAARFNRSDEYFAAILKSDLATMFLTVDSDGQLAAAAIVVESDGYAHYFYGATSSSHLSQSPLKTTIAGVIAWAAERRLPVNLGGGVTQDDSLALFKQRFANREFNLVTYDLVCDTMEPPRENWRLHSLRGWSNGKTKQIPPRAT
jgi:Acetyltransferase (GNAT) domain